MIECYINTKRTLEITKLRLAVIEDTELSLQKEKENLTALSKSLKQNLDKIDLEHKGLTGIKQKLFYEIVINGLKPTKAVDKISIYEDKDVSTIWKNYYPEVKEKIEQLRNQ